ncbi:ABC transporter substrate-binding protein, partial [Psychrobacter sp. 1U2]
MFYQNRFGHFNFSKALLLGGMCTAILTGCNQSAQDTSAPDGAATSDDVTAMKTVAITAIVEHP